MPDAAPKKRATRLRPPARRAGRPRSWREESASPRPAGARIERTRDGRQVTVEAPAALCAAARSTFALPGSWTCRAMQCKQLYVSMLQYTGCSLPNKTFASAPPAAPLIASIGHEPQPPSEPPAVTRAEAESLGDRIAELASRIQAATYELLVLIRDFDAAGAWSGFASCAVWLSWRTGLEPGPAREHVRGRACAGAIAEGERRDAAGASLLLQGARHHPGGDARDRAVAARRGVGGHGGARRAGGAGLAADRPGGGAGRGAPAAGGPLVAHVGGRPTAWWWSGAG